MLNIHKKFNQIRKTKGNNTIVLDGGLGTQLETVYHANISNDFSKKLGNLWSGQVLLQYPELVQRAHSDFVEAGSDIIITNTFVGDLEKFDNDHQAFEKFVKDAVQVARSSEAKIVAGSVGPYANKFLHGTCYTGIYSDMPNDTDLEKESLKIWHLPIIKNMIRNQVDILAFETCPKMIEGIAFSEMIHELQYPGYICFQCKNERETAFGEDFETALEALKLSAYLIGVGVNCVSLKHVSKLVDTLMAFRERCKEKYPHLAPLEIVVYPNSGEVPEFYNGKKEMKWVPDPECWGTFADYCKELISKGATIVGGCCRVYAKDIKQFSESLQHKSAKL